MRGALVLVVMCAAGCNQVFGLRGTEANEGAPPDLDEDGVLDAHDNCPAAANLDQADRDADGFGNPCDFCPDDATPFNHDEDGDLRGDECDRCPVDPDFQGDQDGDGVGDACDDDQARANQLLLFDPFVTIGPAWQNGAAWIISGDAIAPGTEPAPGDPGLLHLGLSIDGTKPHIIKLGLTSPGPWLPGDTFGFSIVDDGGVVVGGCEVRCETTCTIALRPDPTGIPPTPIASTPVATLATRRTPTIRACTLGGTAAAPETDPLGFPSGHLVLHGSPRVLIRSVAVWQ